MTCTHCGGTVVKSYNDVGCFSCGRDPTSPPRAPTAEEEATRKEPRFRSLFETSRIITDALEKARHG